MSDAPAPRVGRAALLSAIAYMLQGAGVTVQQLAQHMGVKLEAAPIVLPPSSHDPDKLLPREQEVLQRIATPDGASVPDLMAMFGISIQTAAGYAAKLERLGRIVRVKAPGVRAPRCFADPVMAQRWVDSHQQAADLALASAREAKAARHAADQQRTAAAVAARAERSRQAQERHAQRLAAKEAAKSAKVEKQRKPTTPAQNVTINPKAGAAPRLEGPAIETEKTQRITDTTRRAGSRVEAAPALPPGPRWPSFSSTPLGVNPDTGKAWGAAT